MSDEYCTCRKCRPMPEDIATREAAAYERGKMDGWRMRHEAEAIAPHPDDALPVRPVSPKEVMPNAERVSDFDSGTHAATGAAHPQHAVRPVSDAPTTPEPCFVCGGVGQIKDLDGFPSTCACEGTGTLGARGGGNEAENASQIVRSDAGKDAGQLLPHVAGSGGTGPSPEVPAPRVSDEDRETAWQIVQKSRDAGGGTAVLIDFEDICREVAKLIADLRDCRAALDAAREQSAFWSRAHARRLEAQVNAEAASARLRADVIERLEKERDGWEDHEDRAIFDDCISIARAALAESGPTTDKP